MLSLRRSLGHAHRPGLATLLVAISTIFIFTPSVSHPHSVSADNDHHAVGFVYVNDNTASNTVEGFARAADGSLTPLPGSPFAVDGQGLGTTGLGSQGGAELSQDGNLLFVVDAGSSQISVLHVHEDGSLSPAAGSPFSSNGIQPVSVAVQDRTVFVANAGTASTVASNCSITGGGSNYTGFRLDNGGRLTPLANSTYCVPPNSALGDVLISPDSRHVVGIRVGANPPTPAALSLIDSFDLDDHGELTVSPDSPFAAQIAGPFGSSFRPTNSSQVFVSDAHGSAGNGAVSAYTVAENATLTPVAGSPFADGQTAPCWLVISHDGQYLYALNTASMTVSSYAIAHDGTLTLLGSSAPTAGTAAPTDTAIDRSGRAIYALEAGAPAVAGFTAVNGTVTDLAGPPFPLPSHPTHPAGIAVK